MAMRPACGAACSCMDADGSLSGSIGALERRGRGDDARSLAEGGMVTAPTSPLLESPTTYQGLTVQEGTEEI